MIQTALEHYREGGFFMHVILLTSMIGFAVLWDKINTLRGAGNLNKDELLNHINSYVLQGQIDKAISVVSQMKNPLTNIMRAGLVAVQNGKDDEEVQTAMDAVALREIPKIQARVGLLSMLANLATLVGLLGTVSGMIGAFSAVANVAPAEKATLLSNAIGEALNCTAFGLLVAIPLLGAYGWVNSWSQKLVDDIHESSVSTLNFILSNRSKFSK